MVEHRNIGAGAGVVRRDDGNDLDRRDGADIDPDHAVIGRRSVECGAPGRRSLARCATGQDDLDIGSVGYGVAGNVGRAGCPARKGSVAAGGEAAKAVVVGCLGLNAVGCVTGALAVGALLRADPEGVVIGEQHLGMRAIGDAVGWADGVAGQVDERKIPGEETARLQLLPGNVQVCSIRYCGCCAARHRDGICDG